jgi:hypothetical protein
MRCAAVATSAGACARRPGGPLHGDSVQRLGRGSAAQQAGDQTLLPFKKYLTIQSMLPHTWRVRRTGHP